MKKILILLSIVLLSGCVTTKPSITEYRVVAKTSKAQSVVDGCKEKSLKIAQAFSSSSLMSLKMDYVQEESKIFSYSQAHWNESPNHSVTKEILKKIRDSKLFKNVQISRSRSKNSWILETNIEDFLQYYSEGLKDSFAKVIISLTLIDSKTNSVIATKTFNSKVNTNTLDAEGGVEALNKALSDILTQNIEWLNGVCSD
ncbi:MAG: membrane integrity-associated transporter subunit PqiC [Sulfurimonas sp.]|nr:membrane integrity-associated transporter subunit PqiC [Sulfurimonas sp.]